MMSNYAKIVKIIDYITLENNAWNFKNISDCLMEFKGIINVYYEKNNRDKNPILKLIAEVDWDCRHHFNENFQERAIDKDISLIRVQLKKDLLGQNINTSIKNINKELYETYSTLRVSNNIFDLEIINEIFSYLEGLTPRIKKNRPELFESYKNIMNLTGPCRAVLPKLVQDDKTAGHHILRKDEELKIDDSFSNLFSNISTFITELEKPKIDILDKIEYELSTMPIINQEIKTRTEEFRNTLKNYRLMEGFFEIYKTDSQTRKKVDELYNNIKVCKDKNIELCESVLKSLDIEKENESIK